VTDPKELDAFLTGLMPRLAAVAREGFGHPGAVHFKSRGQIVTQTDGEVERQAKEAILTTWPDHAILGEEGGAREGTAGTTWYIDPIDGTMNFARGIPFFSVSIGVANHGKMVVGHVMDPLRNEHFRAYMGGGAWLGKEPLQVSAVRELEHANTSLQSTVGSRFVREPGMMLELHRRFQKTRKLGSIALEMAYVAAGRLDFLLAGESRPQPWWDIAGGWVLIEEAGGVFEDLDGGSVTPQSSHFVGGPVELVRQLRAWYGGRVSSG
jgi:myo-inositol-1(or 4)-monophosphatase